MFRWVGDRAIQFAFDGDVAVANETARIKATRAAAFAEVRGAVPAARTLLVHLDGEPSGALVAAMTEPERPGISLAERVHTIEVRYDGADLDDVARVTGLTPRDVIAAHLDATYVVAFVGFQPGFPYLLGLPASLHVPRLPSPRTRVPAGSVAIAAGWCGIYPSASPGGWRLIGSTAATLFDPSETHPAMLRPGDEVRFERG